jgi:hypothetical protein
MLLVYFDSSFVVVDFENDFVVVEEKNYWCEIIKAFILFKLFLI